MEDADVYNIRRIIQDFVQEVHKPKPVSKKNTEPDHKRFIELYDDNRFVADNIFRRVREQQQRPDITHSSYFKYRASLISIPFGYLISEYISKLATDQWLINAASLARQLQVVTHSLKQSHPNASGTQLYVHPDTVPAGDLVGTQNLGNRFTADVTGNAKALGAFKFLQLEYRDQTLLERVEKEDKLLEKSLSDDSDKARSMMSQFARIFDTNTAGRSHYLAKQVFWLTEGSPRSNENFELFAPLYPTALAQRVFETIRHDKSKANEVRDAFYNKEPFDPSYCQYPSLAIQRYGGKKTQNISYLNSKRGGIGYLLNSEPPTWTSRKASPIHAATAFHAYGARRKVKSVVARLGRFYASQPAMNMHDLNYRDRLLSELVDDLIMFTTEMQELEPGWTDDWNCELKFEHQCWLDPHRAYFDTEFAEDMVETNWWRTVREDFSRWLNARIERYLDHTLSDTSYQDVSRVIAKNPAAKATFDWGRKDLESRIENEFELMHSMVDTDE